MPTIPMGGKTAFVLMTFDDRLTPVYLKVVKPVLEQHGYDCKRADEEHSMGPIIDQIRQDINSAALVLCDLTFNNPNVFYELGYAHAIGKTPILLSQQGPDLPFDVRHLRVLIYVDDKYGLLDLRDRLVTCLEEQPAAVMGRGEIPRLATETARADELEVQRGALFANSVEARRWALKFLGDHADTVSYEKIEHIATSPDANPDMLRDAFTALFQIDRMRARSALLNHGLRFQREFLVRERVVELLGRFEADEELLDQMVKQAGDSSWGVRRTVCEVLGRWGDKRGVGQLRAMLNDGEIHVSLAAVEALGRFQREQLGEEAPEIRQEATQTLERLATQESAAQPAA